MYEIYFTKRCGRVSDSLVNIWFVSLTNDKNSFELNWWSFLIVFQSCRPCSSPCSRSQTSLLPTSHGDQITQWESEFSNSYFVLHNHHHNGGWDLQISARQLCTLLQLVNWSAGILQHISRWRGTAIQKLQISKSQISSSGLSRMLGVSI